MGRGNGDENVIQRSCSSCFFGSYWFVDGSELFIESNSYLNLTTDMERTKSDLILDYRSRLGHGSQRIFHKKM